MNVIEEVRKLDLPPREYLVLGSGILGALGIREIGDIDLLVTSRVFDKLRDAGWTYDELEIEGKIREHLSKGDVDRTGVCAVDKQRLSSLVNAYRFLSLATSKKAVTFVTP